MTQDLLKLTASLNIRQGTETTYYKAVRLAEKYADLRVQQERDKKLMNGFVQAFKSGFSIGYKKGYCHRSDKAYTKAMFNMWLKYVAEKEYKCACFSAHARKNNEVKIVDVDFQGKSDCIFTPD